ncbi:MAG: aspartyl/glutamyl-tRNA amidotransferase subunit A [Clostridiales bacterium]|nr:aspartyl/glutamyl-tRNA amidotransferase subunit A [Clostridiales bacterium]
MNISDYTAVSLAAAIANVEVSPFDAMTEYLGKIRDDILLNNFINVCVDQALDEAERIGRDIKNGKRFDDKKLLGVPVAVKDNICTAGVQTTCASRLLSKFVPDDDAEVISRLKRAGAIIIGKTNMDEFAFGSANEYSAFGSVRNALDNNCVAGGSSGGSANSVAAGEAPLALGTDTGGSVRQPAAFCGVVGLKPTYGAINSRGVIGLCPSMEQVGTLSKTCDDALLLFSVLSGRDELRALDGSVRGITVGVAKEFLQAEKSDGVARAFENAIGQLKALGVNIVEVSVPSFFAGLPTYHVLSSAEAMHSFRKVVDAYPDTVLLGDEVKRRMLTGATVTDGENYDKLYIKAAKVRTVITAEYDKALSCCDALLSPTAATVASPIGGMTDPQQEHMCDSYLAPVSLAGLPAVSVPFGKENGLPIGLQIIGKRNAEREILNIGKALMNAVR